MSTIKDMVEHIAKSLADHPEDVEVSEITGGTMILIELDSASEDKGRLIGREGRTINAIRSIAHVLGGKLEKRVRVDVL